MQLPPNAHSKHSRVIDRKATTGHIPALEALERDIAARVVNACSNRPADEFERLVRQIAELELRYLRREASEAKRPSGEIEMRIDAPREPTPARGLAQRLG